MSREGIKSVHGFFDILEKRRNESDIAWALRVWNPKSANYQTYKRSSEVIKFFVFFSYRLKTHLIEISNKKKVPLEALQQEVKNILNEIGYQRQVSVLRSLGFIVTKLLKRLCTSLYINETKFLEMKSNLGNNPVLFVPSHKSYCDFILMSYVCFTYEVDIPRIAAGMDFHSMAITGNILRKACAFFMRRSFINDEIYSAVFSQYVQTLVVDGDAAIEFFIEGTRSRTGKSLMPKYGFLSMALKPFFIGLVPDVTIVPINLSYDRVLEEVLFAYELLGVPKPKESTRGFIKALSILNESYGNMYVQFGEPFSVKQYFGDKIDRSIHGYGSVQLQDLVSEEMKEIIKLAHTIVCRQKELTVLNCFNLIAAVLNNNFLAQTNPLTLEELILEVQWFFLTLKSLTPRDCIIFLKEITKADILKHIQLHKSFVFITKNDEIQLSRIHSENSVIDSTKLKGHILSNNTMEIAIPLLMLQYYVNPCANFLIGVCFMVLILFSKGNSLSLDQLYNDFKFLSSVFAYEFVFDSSFIEKNFEEALHHCQTLNIILKDDSNQLVKGSNEKLHSFCINFLSSFIPGYMTVLEFLLEFSGILTEKEVYKNCQRIVESKLYNGIIIHPANLSLDLLGNALQAFVSMKGVLKIKGKSGIEYQIHHEKLTNIHSKLKLFDFVNKSNSNLLNQFSIFIKNNL